MNVTDAIGLVVSAALAVYLVLSLLRSDRPS
jgi:K+-transporting ATPase KdpF subunit